METRKQRAQRERETIARVGFEHGFVEGGRYVLALLMGLPRPERVVVNDSLAPGVVEIHCAPRSGLQEDRLAKLGMLLEAIKDTDLRTALSPEEEISPARRLEQIVRYCQEVAEVCDEDDADAAMKTLMLEVVQQIELRARGDHRHG